ncbi:MAG: ATP-dependent DNA helicase, partial [Dehalococcoidales bacterium]
MSVGPIDLDSLFERLSSFKREITPDEKFFRETMPERVKGCEIREQQIDMALAVETALKEGKNVIAEAGTGTGKGYAYLVPLVHHIREHKCKAVISTGTIALQEQLLNKDIPFLEEVLGYSLNAKLAKGKGNYLCLLRLDEETKQVALLEEDILDDIYKWSETTRTGDRADFPDDAGDAWGKVCVDDSCTGKKCIHSGRCFYLRAKALLKGADIVVCNHALYFIDMVIKQNSDGFASVLPDYSVAVFDEAHHIESIAREALGTQVSSGRLPMLLSQLRKRTGCNYQAAQDAQAENGLFFALVAESGFGSDKFLLKVNPELEAQMQVLLKAVRGIRHTWNDQYMEDRDESLLAKLDDFSEDLTAILEASNPGYVFWVEVIKNKLKQRIVLHATPIDVAPYLQRSLFENPDIRTVVLTSATLSTSNNFNYLKKQVGCAEAVEVQLDSPFDYKEQCLLYLPTGLPDPKANDFHVKVAPIIESILLKTNGRAFVLFTSYKGMNEVYSLLQGRLPWLLLKQGSMPKQRLLEAFKSDTHSVLFAVASFWEGVSVEGEALSCVILAKLPFAVPDDPITEAKVKAIEKAGGHPFMDFSVPEAIIKLKQGFGRLIRTR